ncbi:hypothetical protein BDP27DRAFT_1432860 [Rhodocollybia butyracea]|uniref:Uncharacterized protein n=1 Tax=Rhodocollybia butyracea TaxID=206335 RepID=A0A9P5P8Y0_9AGAR|nr:hypothetical protein BDP27DRAFT_1432860 [Rhodocollybia butyracea]
MSALKAAGINAVLINSSVLVAKRTEVITRFKTDPDVDLLLMSTISPPLM